MKIRLRLRPKKILRSLLIFMNHNVLDLVLISMTALPQTLNLCGSMQASMKPIVASIAPFQSDSRFRSTTVWQTIASTSTLFSTQGKTPKR